MLFLAKQMLGALVEASDGKLGKLVDFLFDDHGWEIKSLVLDSGSWLNSRRVTLPPDMIRHRDWADHRLFIAGLTRHQVVESPSVETHITMGDSAKLETATIVDWGRYWSTIIDHPWQVSDDPHLHNTQEVTGYHLQVTDGRIGHVADFLIDDENWHIRFIEADTRNWWFGKRVLILPDRVSSIDGEKRILHVNLSRDSLEHSPVYSPTMLHEQFFETAMNARL